MGHSFSPHQCAQYHAENPPDELGDDVERCVPWLDCSEVEERERYRRIEVCAGLLAPRRINKCDGGQPHRYSGQSATEKGARNHLPNDRAWVLQEDREAACRHHEQAEACRFHQILRPVIGGGRDRARKPGSACGWPLGRSSRLLHYFAPDSCLHLPIGFGASVFGDKSVTRIHLHWIWRAVSPFGQIGIEWGCWL